MAMSKGKRTSMAEEAEEEELPLITDGKVDYNTYYGAHDGGFSKN